MGAVALDMDKIAKTVAEEVKKEIEKKPEAERPDVEQVARLAAEATARAQQSALQVRAAVGPLVPPDDEREGEDHGNERLAVHADHFERRVDSWERKPVEDVADLGRSVAARCRPAVFAEVVLRHWQRRGLNPGVPIVNSATGSSSLDAGLCGRDERVVVAAGALRAGAAVDLGSQALDLVDAEPTDPTG
jgi:hypothetical protein